MGMIIVCNKYLSIGSILLIWIKCAWIANFKVGYFFA